MSPWKDNNTASRELQIWNTINDAELDTLKASLLATARSDRAKPQSERALGSNNLEKLVYYVASEHPRHTEAACTLLCAVAPELPPELLNDFPLEQLKENAENLCAFVRRDKSDIRGHKKCAQMAVAAVHTIEGARDQQLMRQANLGLPVRHPIRVQTRRTHFEL